MSAANSQPSMAAATRARDARQREAVSQQATGQTLAESVVWPLKPVKLSAALPMPQPMKAIFETAISAPPTPKSSSQTPARSAA